ncbi:hypothetical protein O181_011487 [Austropuccinia psidii MF-1]|uniref:GCF C-terminal domain-containing protein n=1 Tax=Austropuccinia psidii MF-1 TaxID=1389203 RepID=A0A9Q3BUK6_9BASI|nr:hypothetical protein [Austropuccinia psidii MF-1]
MNEEDHQDKILFKKKKSKSKSNLRKSFGSISLGNHQDQNAENENEVVVKSNLSLSSAKSNSKAIKNNKFKIQLDSSNDTDNDQPSFQSNKSPSVNPTHRKLARPQSYSSSINLSESGPNSPTSRSVIESSRPMYSTTHLNELKSLTISTPNFKSNDESFDSLTTSKFAFSDVIDNQTGFDSIDQIEINIPSTSTIQSAKEKRFQARKSGLSYSNSIDTSTSKISPEQDFISLSYNSNSLEHFGPPKKGESRLVREDDDIGEGDDEHAEYTGAKERVPLGQQAGLKAEKIKKAGMEAMILDTEDDLQEGNEEELQWEAAQIRRGASGSLPKRMANDTEQPVYRPAPIPEHDVIAPFDSVESRLLSYLQNVETLVSEQQEASLCISTEKKNLDNQEIELRQQVSREVQRGDFFEDLNQFIKDIDFFLAQKWPQLEKIEQDLLSILKERRELIFQRRFESFSDDLVLFKNGVIGVTRPLTTSKTESGLQPDQQDVDEQQGETVDELGRSRPDLDVSIHAPARTLRRQERIQRRKRRLERKNNTAELLDNEDDQGFSTDDSLSPADSSDLLTASQSLVSSSKELLVDVTNPAFLSPTHQGSLSDRFLRWKSKYPEEYENAFGNLALVQAWEFWVRVEMVAGLNIWGLKNWAKSDDKCGIENWEWRKGLEVFDHEAQAKSLDQGFSESESVIAAMISTVIIPFLSTIIKCSYDPFSGQATTKSLELVEQVGYVIETNGNPTYDTFVSSFLCCFESSVYELKHLVGSKQELIESLGSQIGMDGIRARQRFLRKCLKLLKQGVRWKRFASQAYWIDGSTSNKEKAISLKSLLIEQLLGEIMLPILLVAWQTGGKEIAEQILTLCSDSFIPPELQKTLQTGS